MNERDRATAATPPHGSIQGAWWGEFPFEIGVWGHWRVGPLALWLGRNEHDWQIVYARDVDPFHDESYLEVPVAA